MSKKAKIIELVEDEKVVDGVSISELKLGDQLLGTVESDNNKFTASLPDGESFNVKSHEEAMNILISHYHLHS